MPNFDLAPLSAPRLSVAATPPLAALGTAASAQFALPAAGADPLLQVLTPAPAGTGAPAAPTAVLLDGAAMRPDQVIMARQLAWPLPESGAMAASWRAMVRAYGAALAGREQQARGQHLPAALFMSGQEPAALRDGAQAGAAGGAEAWRFAVFGWERQKLALSVLAAEPDRPPGRRRRGKVALRLELTLADGSRVAVQIEPLPDGIVLDLAATTPAVLRQLREALPALADAVGRAGLRILRCTIRDQLQSGRTNRNDPALAAAAGLTLPVFKAMAEVALLLSRPAAEPAPA